MTEDLQSLLEKINRDGVEKAQAEAARIVAAAKAEAEAFARRAREEAARAKESAEKDAAAYAERAKETLRQAARDTLLEIEAAVTGKLVKLLTADVNRALADEKTAATLAAEAIRALTGPGEIAVSNAKLADALKAQLAAAGDFKVVLDETMDTGFTVKLDGGRVEHAFTGKVVAGELAKRLRPDLAALL